MTRENVERLKAELERQSRRRERRRYPSELRDAAVRYGMGVRAAGGSCREAAASLGLRAATLQKWMRERPAGEPRGAFRRVELVEEARPVTLVVVTPRGLRIEGLGLTDVMTLVERMG